LSNRKECANIYNLSNKNYIVVAVVDVAIVANVAAAAATVVF